MTAYAVLRLLIGLYIIVVGMICFHAVSSLIFDRQKDASWVCLAKCLLGFIWPLLIFSKGGRKKIKQLTRRL